MRRSISILVIVLFAMNSVWVGAGGTWLHSAHSAGTFEHHSSEIGDQHLSGGLGEQQHRHGGVLVSSTVDSKHGRAHHYGPQAGEFDTAADAGGLGDDCAYGDCCPPNSATLTAVLSTVASTALTFENTPAASPLHAEVKYLERPPRLS